MSVILNVAMISSIFNTELYFNKSFRAKLGKYTLYLAIGSFLIHLILYLSNDYLQLFETSELLANPINAIYTPFSVLLIYEAYLLIFYLRQSTTIYIGKQYEIIALILIRGIFKDMTHLERTSDGWSKPGNMELWIDLATVLASFFMIYLFYRISGLLEGKNDEDLEKKNVGRDMKRFIQSKNILSLCLVYIFVGLAIYSLVEWIIHLNTHTSASPLIDINAVFFEQLFTVLIMCDVLILLLSLLYTDDFAIITRNSGFIISTILLKMSFSAEHILSQTYIIVGIGFGVLMLAVSNKFASKSTKKVTQSG